GLPVRKRTLDGEERHLVVALQRATGRRGHRPRQPCPRCRAAAQHGQRDGGACSRSDPFQCPPSEWTVPAGCASIQWKYLIYPAISASLRLWFGIGRLLYCASIALASGSDSSIFSGALSQRVSHASLRRLVTPTRSGPSLSPLPMEWQARHLLSKESFACTVNGSVGVAEAAKLWCSSSATEGRASVEMSPTA